MTNTGTIIYVLEYMIYIRNMDGKSYPIIWMENIIISNQDIVVSREFLANLSTSCF